MAGPGTVEEKEMVWGARGPWGRARYMQWVGGDRRRPAVDTVLTRAVY